jgi:hypothetical protein
MCRPPKERPALNSAVDETSEAVYLVGYVGIAADDFIIQTVRMAIIIAEFVNAEGRGFV